MITWVRGADPQVSVAEIGWIGSYVCLAAELVALGAANRHGRQALDSMIDMAAVAIVSLVVVWQAYMAVTPGDTINRWLDIGWMLGAILLGAAAWTLGHWGSGAAVDDDRVGTARISLLMAVVATPQRVGLWAERRGESVPQAMLLLATAMLAPLVLARSLRLLHAAQLPAPLPGRHREDRPLVRRRHRRRRAGTCHRAGPPRPRSHAAARDGGRGHRGGRAARLARAEHCNLGQGFLFAEPMGLDDVQAFLGTTSPRSGFAPVRPLADLTVAAGS